MKSNIATDSSQSQRLLRCGVSADTADMCWFGAIVPRGGSLTSMPEPSEEWELWTTPYWSMPEEMQKATLMEDCNEIKPAWSLSALLINILPNSIVIDGIEHVLCVYSGEYKDADPIEISVRMIEWMNENGYKLKVQ